MRSGRLCPILSIADDGVRRAANVLVCICTSDGTAHCVKGAALMFRRRSLLPDAAANAGLESYYMVLFVPGICVWRSGESA